MKKLFVAVYALLSLAGCSTGYDCDSSGEQSMTKKELIGTWVVKVENDKTLLTNDMFVMRFNENDIQEYSGMDAHSSGESSWVYKDNSTYTIKNNIIHLLSQGDDIQLNGSISYGELLGRHGDILSYREIKNIDGGEDMNEGRSFKGIRCDDDYSSEIVGVWIGKVIEGDTSEPFDEIKVEYHRTGQFDFYHLQENGEWFFHKSNKGKYWVLGNIFASQWYNEVDGEPTTQQAEAWEISIKDDKMTWRATREGSDKELGFDLVRE